MNAVELEDVGKTFTLRVGRGLWNRERRIINAVDGISFGVLSGSLASLALGTLVFYIGLHRYESGTPMEMRG